jgi:hypothetical protein
MHVDFDPLEIEWSLLTGNEPQIYQTGGYAVFRGLPYQRGSGLGSVFRRLFRYLLPIGKEIGSAIGRQGLESGSRVLTNVLEGKDLKQSLVDEGRMGLKSLLDKASSNLEKTQQQTGKGSRFDFKRYQKVTDPKIGKSIHKLASTMGPPNFLPPKPRKKKAPAKKASTTKKRLRIDSLGTY